MKGSVSIEYLLVASMLVLGLVAAVYRPGENGRNLGEAFEYWYQEMGKQVAKP